MLQKSFLLLCLFTRILVGAETDITDIHEKIKAQLTPFTPFVLKMDGFIDTYNLKIPKTIQLPEDLTQLAEKVEKSLYENPRTSIDWSAFAAENCAPILTTCPQGAALEQARQYAFRLFIIDSLLKHQATKEVGYKDYYTGSSTTQLYAVSFLRWLETTSIIKMNHLLDSILYKNDRTILLASALSLVHISGIPETLYLELSWLRETVIKRKGSCGLAEPVLNCVRTYFANWGKDELLHINNDYYWADYSYYLYTKPGAINYIWQGLKNILKDTLGEGHLFASQISCIRNLADTDALPPETFILRLQVAQLAKNYEATYSHVFAERTLDLMITYLDDITELLKRYHKVKFPFNWGDFLILTDKQDWLDTTISNVLRNIVNKVNYRSQQKYIKPISAFLDDYKKKQTT